MKSLEWENYVITTKKKIVTAQEYENYETVPITAWMKQQLNSHAFTFSWTPPFQNPLDFL